MQNCRQTRQNKLVSRGIADSSRRLSEILEFFEAKELLNSVEDLKNSNPPTIFFPSPQPKITYGIYLFLFPSPMRMVTGRSPSLNFSWASRSWRAAPLRPVVGRVVVGCGGAAIGVESD